MSASAPWSLAGRGTYLTYEENLLIFALKGAAIPTAAAVGQTAVVYVAKRTDGGAGTGSYYDPYNQTTANNLDTILSGLPAAHVTVMLFPNSSANPYVVHYKPNGNNLTGVLSLALVGMGGPGSAYVRLADNEFATAGDDGTLVGSAAYYLDSLAFANLTVDANNAGQPIVAGALAGRINLLFGSAKHIRYENIRLIGGYASTVEGFIGNSSYRMNDTTALSPASSIYRNCHATGIVGGCSVFGTFPSDSNGSTGDYVKQFIQTTIENSSVSGNGLCNAFGAGVSGVIRDCWADNVLNAVQLDTFFVGDLIIDRLRATNINGYGVNANGNNAGQYKRLHIKDCRFECKAGTESTGWVIQSPDIESCIVERCKVVQPHVGFDARYLGNFESTPNVLVRECTFPKEWAGVLPYTALIGNHLGTTGKQLPRFIDNWTDDGQPAMLTSTSVQALAENSWTCGATAAIGEDLWVFLARINGQAYLEIIAAENGSTTKHCRLQLSFTSVAEYVLNQQGTDATARLYMVSGGGSGYIFYKVASTAAQNVASIRVRAVGPLVYVAPIPSIIGATVMTVT